MIKPSFSIWGVKLQILVLGTYINKIAKKNFLIQCKNTPTKCDLLFALSIVNLKKKNLRMLKKNLFSAEMHSIW